MVIRVRNKLEILHLPAGSEDSCDILGSETASMSRQYSLAHRDLEVDEQLFEDDFFALEPLQGTVWPGVRHPSATNPWPYTAFVCCDDS